MGIPHTPVLVDEVVSTLGTKPDGCYLDTTFGGGGHSRALLHQLAPTANLFVSDRDPVAVSLAQQLAATDSRVTYDTAKFSELAQILSKHELSAFDGILMDIGVSSMQLDNAARGFSFLRDGPLDMRMDLTRGETAADWLNRASFHEISQILNKFGEERDAHRITKAILEARPLTSTTQLVRVINQAAKVRDSRKHVATRVFQAIRIYLNDELEELRKGLLIAGQFLAVSGRLAVISFHSLEHRIVREQFLSWSAVKLPAKLPVRGAQNRSMKIIERGIRPSTRELQINKRSSAALMQVIERVE
ncbi:MAG: 16S rRNA (cytosine(1402)-N(4))-methyltransferase RsmH [Gammaproteobacteria bacterium]|nr:16S rRNA (cytosine(1402)-N(4))-methyltransferase RsmH [Gammaproteobacteria bacterium]MDE0252363.1 16S rRNA (cytosine(1402)-N(4))-methyltransferase RsmH [Gammaproteobacteria bacterium]MDE0402528.1 16S rRNA (cytosine(1402)-N(4))-methyltransferase RsmH [Gammaproteobacteria bacterium]